MPRCSRFCGGDSVQIGAGAESRHQIGWVVVGGMSVDTVFTPFLIVVPNALPARASHLRKAVVDVAAAPRTGRA